MRTLVIIICLLLPGVCFAQNPASTSVNSILTDLKGSPIPVGSAINVDGTPFFNEAWSRGTVILFNGTKYENVILRLNLHTDEVHYQTGPLKSEMIAAKGSVKEVQLNDPERPQDIKIFRSGFPVIEKNDLMNFYNVLADGKVVLLKQTKKVITEDKPFNSATLIRKYEYQKAYFIFKDNSIIKIKKSNDGIITLLTDQREAVKTYISSNKLNCKSDDDLVKVINYYNSR